MTVGTRNRRALAANFQAADARAQRAARKIVVKYADKQFRLTRELAPVDTGFLRSHIRQRISDDGLAYEIGVREEDFEGAGKPFYPVYLEFGTRFMHARPFIFPARDKIAPEFRRALGQELSAAIRRRGR
jgi:HK97 gp10 family phage protein